MQERDERIRITWQPRAADEIFSVEIGERLTRNGVSPPRIIPHDAALIEKGGSYGDQAPKTLHQRL